MNEKQKFKVDDRDDKNKDDRDVVSRTLIASIPAPHH